MFLVFLEGVCGVRSPSLLKVLARGWGMVFQYGPEEINDSDCRVSEFIDNATYSWKLEKLNDVFDQDTQAAILSIPLVHFAIEDTMFWGLTKNGSDSVKSGYCLVKLGSFSSAEDGNKLWCIVWNVQGPPKMHYFL